MADTTINVNSGFYNAVNDDRTYYAEDMTRPYKRLVANGVFATAQGTPSTDLQVRAGSGMQVTVLPGEGIFADKWFENPAAISFNVPTVTFGRSRIDSVIVQIDLRSEGRVGSIVYRTGTAAVNPVQPDINTVANVVEYRIANIEVTALTNTQVSDAMITDLRGTSSCPWVRALIQQPDIDTMWTQYKAAYSQLLAAFEEDWTVHLQNAEDDWGAFLSQVSTDLAVTPNILQLKSTYTAQSPVTVVPIGIPNYDKTTDLLLVFINGFMAAEGTFWTLNDAGTAVNLPDPLEINDRVDFVVMKSVVTASLTSVTGAIQDLEDLVENVASDSGWSSDGVSFINGSPNVSTAPPQLRKIGNVVYMRGNFRGVTGTGNVFTIPLAYAPKDRNHLYTSCAQNGTSVIPVVLRIGYRGADDEAIVGISAYGGTFSETDVIQVDTSWMID